MPDCTEVRIGRKSRAQPGDQLFEIIDPAEALRVYGGALPIARIRKPWVVEALRHQWTKESKTIYIVDST